MISPGQVAFSIGNIDIAYYGILIAFGFLLSGTIAYLRAPLHKVDQDHFLNLILFLVPSSIIGARAYYVIFEWDYYKRHLDQILNVRGGGLAIHGGLILGIIVAILVFRYYKEKPLPVFDLAFTCVPLGQAIGRWGNFFNEEAHGIETDLPWAQIIDGVGYHPTFLYESIWCLLLFFFLLWYDTKKITFDGETFILYLVLYSLERFFVEGLRTDSLMIGNIRQAQLLSIVVIVLGVIAFIYLKKKNKKEVKENE